jgi:hypothetical protein
MPRLKGKTYSERRASKDAASIARLKKRHQPDKQPRNLVDVLDENFPYANP